MTATPSAPIIPESELREIPKSVCYRNDWTPEAYDEAIADLQNAKRDLIARNSGEMGCRPSDFETFGDFHEMTVGRRLVAYASASRGSTQGWCYWVDGQFGGFTGMDADQAGAIRAIRYHVELAGQ